MTSSQDRNKISVQVDSIAVERRLDDAETNKHPMIDTDREDQPQLTRRPILVRTLLDV